MKIHKLFIGGVDGVSSWSAALEQTKGLLEFYKQYGHEGDNVYLEVWEGENINVMSITKGLYNEDVFKYIEEQNAKSK